MTTSREPTSVESYRPADLDRDWADLRARCPVSRTGTSSGSQIWLAARYTDIRMVLSHSTFSVSPIEPAPDSPFTERKDSIFQDPPEHTRLRGLVSSPFAVGKVGVYHDPIRAKADELIGAMARRGGPVDMMSGFAKPLTMNAISDVVGVPVADRQMFQDLSDRLLVPLSEQEGETARSGWRELNEYVAGLIADRRAAGERRGDLIDHMIQAQERDDALTDKELTTMVLGLPVAGYVSTANAIVLAVRHLAEDGWLTRMRTDHGGEALQEKFVEEVLRHQSGDNGESMPRFALEDFDLGGITITRGECVVAPLVAANRDETVFDRPDEFDPLREGLLRHIAFGFGIHRCPGANLARLELQIAVAALVDSGIGLTMLESWKGVPWLGNMFGDHFPERLMVEVTSPAGAS